MESVYGHTVLHNDPVVAAEMRLVKNATTSIRGPQQGRGIADTLRGLTGTNRVSDDQKQLLKAKLGEIGSPLQSHDPLKGVRRTGTAMLMETLGGSGARCTAITKKGTRCRNASTNFGDSKLCGVHSRQAMGKSEMANIREYRAENPASGPGMYRDALNQWVVDDSIRLEAGASMDDAIEL